MSLELANEKWLGHNPNGLLGQFASTLGHTELIAEAKKHKLDTLREFFKTGVTGDVDAARKELQVLIDNGGDVGSTAKAMYDLAKDQEMIIITNGGN